MLAEPLLRNPTMDLPCCARAATGHEIKLPPKRKLNSRRLIAALDGQERASYQFAQVVRKGSMSALGHKRTFRTAPAQADMKSANQRRPSLELLRTGGFG